MHTLAERLLTTIRKQESIRAGDRVGAAVSGGADSVALLCLLLELRAELGIVLAVAHVNHKLRSAESDEDERFVAELARQHGLELHVREAPVRRHDTGVEAAARELRYDFFWELAKQNRVAKIVTAHTLDDQAETVLLRIFRGTGIRGLSSIHSRIVLEDQGRVFGEVVRPLLAFRRAALVEYLRETGQSWREDASNLDTAFRRNRVRHRLLPLITEDFGEAAIEHMGELAEIARAEEEHWLASTQYSVPSTQTSASSSAPLEVERILSLPLAASRRLVRAWIEANAAAVSISFRLIEEILDFARAEAGKIVELPRGYRVRRSRDQLCLERSESDLREYRYSLPIPGEVEIPELGIQLRAIIVDPKSVPETDRDSLLDPACLSGVVLVRNWQAGDRYWPAHTKQEKKVKDLLSDRQAAGTQKKLWPVAVGRGDLVWMRGFAVPVAVRAPEWAAKAIWIREIVG